ncbi:MAG: histidine--tRNA ligase [Rickettsiales bacterium]|nr:histidine--tRNA ligase [Rickettsiales bacterium]
MNLKPTKPLSGFIELTPTQQRAFDEYSGKLLGALKTAGFQRLDLPTIERFEVLTDKENFEDIDTEMYVFEKGDTKMGLRYDGTIGLARYVAGHLNDIAFPFRACQMAKNYRAERPQKGRYREFYQIDLDILGQGELSANYDVEIIATTNAALKSIEGAIGEVYVRVGNRAFWNAAFKLLGISDEKARGLLVLIDKKDKMSAEDFEKALIDSTGDSKVSEILKDYKSIAGKSAAVDAAIRDLEFIVEQARAMGCDARLDLSIMRGHGYYTGSVFEFFLKNSDMKSSVAAGGRYENLVDKFSKTKIVGVGAGFGPSRLLVPPLEDGKIDLAEFARQADAIVLPMGQAYVPAAMEAAAKLRASGAITTAFLDADKKFKHQIEYADKTGARFAVIIGEDEAKQGVVALKDMQSGEQAAVSIQDAIQTISRTQD